MRESHEAADVATKGDIADLRHEIKEVETSLRHEIKEVETSLRHEIKESVSTLRQEMSEMKFELLKWIIGLAIAQAGLLIGILKFLP